jgi:hypothetical protein
MFALAQGPRSSTSDIVVMVGVIVLCAVIAIVFVRWWRRFSRKDQHTEVRPVGFEDIYALAQENAETTASAYQELKNPDVAIEFHTYTRSGFIGIKQDVHRLTLPALGALELVKLLHAYNLRGCLVPYKGVVYVPLLSYLEARKVRSKIELAMRAAANQSDLTS